MLKRKIIFIAIALFAILLPISLYAQDDAVATSGVNEADGYFTQGDFEDALEAYLTLVDKYPENELFNYRVGVCYLNTNVDKAKAISYLELVVHSKKNYPNALYLLARAYQFAYRFDDAIKTFTDFKKEGRGASENIRDADLEIQYCINAKELMKFPISATFENLGKNVNSPYDDYYPFVPTDESFLVFNSKRAGTGKEKATVNSYPPSIYISRVKDGEYTPAVGIGSPIDMPGKSEEVIGLSKEGDYMLFYYIDKKGFGNIYITNEQADKTFSTPVQLPEVINQKGQSKIAASITSDGSTIYFASDRPGGFGGIDLYVSRRIPNGNWGTPQNLGTVINTPSNEDFPNISPDGKTLYFSSQGHTSMGGYDIFKASLSDSANKWQSVQNMGYPINTPDDDMNFRLATNGRYGYISQVRKGGLGGLDIYRVTFNAVDQRYSVVKGLISTSDTTVKIKDYTDVMITVSDAKTQELYGNYVPNSATGRYVIILPAGRYHAIVQVDGFDPYKEDINVEDKSSFQTEVNKDISLIPAKPKK
ncbi:MAG TPA: tetratricopeptide repeat protein [Bacteroidia bacterium]|nr:tetratricopeptide repeat protein [Bacteroidia bacterium]